jgi:hypothetical protein
MIAFGVVVLQASDLVCVLRKVYLQLTNATTAAAGTSTNRLGSVVHEYVLAA